MYKDETGGIRADTDVDCINIKNVIYTLRGFLHHCQLIRVVLKSTLVE